MIHFDLESECEVLKILHIITLTHMNPVKQKAQRPNKAITEGQFSEFF